MAKERPDASVLRFGEQSLPAYSLARKENWPQWTQQVVGRFSGLMALEIISKSQSYGDFYFLGMPYLSEELIPRISKFTNSKGEYVTEPGPAKIALVNDPACGVLRALVNRINLSDLSNVDGECWSGWFPYQGRLHTITTTKMVRAMFLDEGLKFVAVCNRNTIDPALIEEDPKRPFEINVRNPDDPTFTIKPDLIVPVSMQNFPSDFPRDILVIDAGRTEAAEIYALLLQLSDADQIPSVVRLSNGNEVPINRFGNFLLRLFKEDNLQRCA